MKQAILITAYRYLDQLERLIDWFPSSHFSLYIHIDKKTTVPNGWFLNNRVKEQVAFIGQNYKVNWGGVNHLKAYLLLCKLAIQNKENHYFHLITGQDFPAQSADKFSFFTAEENIQSNFILFAALPQSWWDGNGGVDRVEYYNLYDSLNAKSFISKLMIRSFVLFQKIFRIKRSLIDLPRLYGGSTYWSLSREAVECVTFHAENTRLLERFKYTFCAEEMFFQTVLLNSGHAPKCVNRDFRYMDWSKPNGGGPKVLDASDYEKIKNSGAFFVRKVLLSNGLIERIVAEERALFNH